MDTQNLSLNPAIRFVSISDLGRWPSKVFRWIAEGNARVVVVKNNRPIGLIVGCSDLNSIAPIGKLSQTEGTEMVNPSNLPSYHQGVFFHETVDHV